jgi:hypothetical protein
MQSYDVYLKLTETAEKRRDGGCVNRAEHPVNA